jgi:hypothetical protein
MRKYYGLGKESNYNWILSIFLGSKLLQICFWTKKYKLMPRFYWYTNCEWGEQHVLKIKWLVGISLNVA